MTKRELAETLLTRVPKDELDDVMQLLVYRRRKPANIRPSVELRDGFRTLTAQEFDEFLLEYGPEMQPCHWERLSSLLHPEVHWTTAAEEDLHGPHEVIARLAADPPPAPPSFHELRDGLMYRWIDCPG